MRTVLSLQLSISILASAEEVNFRRDKPGTVPKGWVVAMTHEGLRSGRSSKIRPLHRHPAFSPKPPTTKPRGAPRHLRGYLVRRLAILGVGFSPL